MDFNLYRGLVNRPSCSNTEHYIDVILCSVLKYHPYCGISTNVILGQNLTSLCLLYNPMKLIVLFPFYAFIVLCFHTFKTLTNWWKFETSTKPTRRYDDVVAKVMDEESPRSIYAKKNNIGRKQNGFFTRKSKCIFLFGIFLCFCCNRFVGISRVHTQYDVGICMINEISN